LSFCEKQKSKKNHQIIDHEKDWKAATVTQRGLKMG